MKQLVRNGNVKNWDELLNREPDNKKWEIKSVDDKFMVGVLNKKTFEFDPICSCESYDQADLVWAALKDYIYAKNYSSKGVGGCQRVTGKVSKPTARMVLPG